MQIIVFVFLFSLAFAFIGLLLKLLKKPMKWALKLFLHALLGYAFLFIFNFVGAWVDLSLGLNWVNAMVIGVLGVPGVILLLLIQYIL